MSLQTPPPDPVLFVESVLMHASAPYDPAKAHEYYLRYRKLHPRDKNSQPAPTGKSGNKSPTYTVRAGTNRAVRLSAQQLQEQKLYAKSRVDAINKKLVDLNAKLRKKMADAKKREANAKKAPTAADKNKAARDAKAYRDKHKNKIKANAKKAAAKKAPAKKVDTVSSLKREIASAKTSLKDAVAKQRELASARKNG